MRLFVTGAGGWIGSSAVAELLAAGHQVAGLARSDASAAALEKAGVTVVRGTLDDLDVLRSAAAGVDGVIHLAFKHDLAFTGDFEGAVAADRRAVEAFGEVLAGTGKALVIASGVAGHPSGAVITEDDAPNPDGAVAQRMLTERRVLELAGSGVRSASVRFAPTVHGAGDHGFVATLVAVARDRGVSAYVGDGANRWPAVHRGDAGRLVRLAVEAAPPGSVLHAIAEEGVPTRDIAAAIAAQLGVETASIAPEDAAEHFGWVGGFFGGIDVRASSARTRELLGWEPTGPTLIEDLEAGAYTTRGSER